MTAANGISKCFVRSGIRTHAHRSGLRPERSALDRSAILTLKKTWPISYTANRVTFLQISLTYKVPRETGSIISSAHIHQTYQLFSAASRSNMLDYNFSFKSNVLTIGPMV